MSLPTLHDTLRHLIRSMAFRDEASQRNALLSVDAHEREFGTSDTDAYRAELDRQARAGLPPTAEELAQRQAASAEERAAAAEARAVRAEALLAAQTRPTAEPPAVPATPTA